MPGGTAPAKGPLVAAVPRRAECLGARDTLSGPFLPLGPWISGRSLSLRLQSVCVRPALSFLAVSLSCCLSACLCRCPSLWPHRWRAPNTRIWHLGSVPVSPHFAPFYTTWGRNKSPSLLEKMWQSASTPPNPILPITVPLGSRAEKNGEEKKCHPLFFSQVALLFSGRSPLARRRHLSSTGFYHPLSGMNRSSFLLVCKRPFAAGLSCPDAATDPVKQRTDVYHVKEGD